MPLTAISVEGLNALQSALRSASTTGVPKALAVANKSAAATVVKRAVVPTRSGRLTRSVRALGSQRLGRVRAGGSGVAYAAAIHWGRKRGNVGSPPGNHPGRNAIRGRPFLTDAARAALPEVVHDYEQAIDAIVVAAINATKGN